MKRLPALGSLLLALAAVPVTASAQDIDNTLTSFAGCGIQVELRKVGDDPYTTTEKDIGKTACDANVNLTFRLTGVPSGIDAPEHIWVLVGDACSTEERRDGQGDDDCAEVTDFVRPDTTSTQLDVTVPIGPLCDINGDATVFFLPVASVPTPGVVATCGAYTVPVDRTPPSAPLKVRGGAGETEIPVRWDQGSGAAPTNYYLVWDPTPIIAASGDAGANSGDDAGADDSAEECSSDRLIAGEEFDVDDLPTGLVRKDLGSEVRSATLSGEEIGGDMAAVAVIAEDRAGNRSVLSNVACVEVVPTDGFWDAYKNGGGDAETGCACSVPSASRSPFSALPVALALMALRVRRKRRS